MSANFLTPVSTQSTPEIIAERLRNAIAGGDLPPGAQLHETALAEQLGVSRGPLREALQRLTQEGLLISIRNRGVFVIEMTPGRIYDMYLARAAIERAAAEEVLRKGNSARVVAELRLCLEEIRNAINTHDVNATTNADVKFHRTLVQLADSPRLSRVHDTLLTETQMCIRALETRYAFGDGRADEHESIVDALESDALSYDPDSDRRTAVDMLLVAHMSDAIERLST